jgi:hypothetical protein
MVKHPLDPNSNNVDASVELKLSIIESSTYVKPNIVDFSIDVEPNDVEVSIDSKSNVDFKENIVKPDVSKLVDNDVNECPRGTI